MLECIIRCDVDSCLCALTRASHMTRLQESVLESAAKRAYSSYFTASATNRFALPSSRVNALFYQIENKHESHTLFFRQVYNTIDYVTTAFSMFSGIFTALTRLIVFVGESILFKAGESFFL